MKKILFTLLGLFMTHLMISQTVNITVDASKNKRLISPSIYGKNEDLDKSVQFYKDAGLRFTRLNHGNNATGYNWRKKLTISPDWYNNVYSEDWDAKAQNLDKNYSNMQGMFAFQLLGRVASNNQHNFDDWGYNQSKKWSGTGQNLAGGGKVNPDGGSKALVDGDMTLFTQPWPADSSVAILTHWFGTNGLGLNKNKFVYWNMDNEVDIWNGTHDYAMPTLISASAFMDRYIELAKKAKALYPGIKLCGPVATSEWQWYKWSNESIKVNDRYYCWLEYFIKRLADEYNATGIKLVDVVDIHNYPSYNNDEEALQGHRIYYDENYDYPGSNGIKTINGGWDNTITKQYIFKRINDWLNEHFGANHGITLGVSEWGTMTSKNTTPNIESVVYASHLGTFANNGVELFSPWYWSVGMWETMHLFSKYAKKYSVSSVSSVENTVSAYTSINEAADSLTVIIVNRDMNSAQNVTVNLSNFSVSDGKYTTLQLSSLPTDETFVSETQNSLKTGTVSVNSNSLTLSAPSLSTTAIILTKSTTTSATYVTLKNRATGLLIDGMGRTSVGSRCGQWGNSGSWNQMWTLETNGSYVYIKNRSTGLYIDGRGISTNGSYVGQWNSSTSYNLQWQQITEGDYVKFKNRATGLYLDGLGKTNSGADLGQWKKSSSYNQQWLVSSGLKSAAEGKTIENVSENNEIQLFPNPFSTEINLRIGNPEQLRGIEVLDMSGKQVEFIKSGTIKSNQTIGSSLKTGVYILKIYSVDKVQSFRLIKK